MVCRLLMIVWICLMAGAIGLAVEVPVGDVVLKCEFEDFGTNVGSSLVELAGASGGTGMALTAESMAVAGVKFGAGKYTLLLRTFAPAGDQDGFFVEISGVRTRRTAPIGSWGSLAYPFEVRQPAATTISVIGQEPGLVVDQVAIVNGTYADASVDIMKLGPARSQMLAPVEMPRLKVRARLKALPEAPGAADERTLHRQSFDQAVTGVVGEHHREDGKWGQALFLDMPDGRLSLDTAALKFGPMGTVEWWVKPRPGQRLWHDQGWHYFLSGIPAAAEGVRLEVYRRHDTHLQLSVTAGQARESIQLPTNQASLDEWHHLLVSWDFTGERQYLWFLFDGVGLAAHFPRVFAAPAFSCLEFGNTPPGSELPLLAMDGGIDELQISSVSVAGRLGK